MRKLFLFILSLSIAAGSLPAFAVGTSEGMTQIIEEQEQLIEDEVGSDSFEESTTPSSDMIDIPLLTVKLSEGSKSEEVASAQRKLLILGYLQAEPDGQFGSKTLAAVKAFQEKNGLPMSGEIDVATWTLLFSGEAVSNASIEENVVPPLAETLVTGMKSEDVASAQRRLYALGYLDDEPDCHFGKKTVAAVNDFQKSNELPITGEIDTGTWTLLFNGEAKQKVRTLKKSSHGEAVSAVQDALIRLGFLTGYSDGAYGKRTVAAVKAVQSRLISLGIEGIQETGECDPLTQQYLLDPSFSGYIKTVALGYSGTEAQRIENRLIALGWMDGSADTEFDEYAVECLNAFLTASGESPNGTADSPVMTLLFSADAPTSEFPVGHDIRVGDRGDVIMALQKLMARYGYLSGVPDGAFGIKTSEAIGRFHSYLIETGSEYAPLFEDTTYISKETMNVLTSTDFHVYQRTISEASSSTDITRLQRRLSSLYYISTGAVDGMFGNGTTKALKKFQAICGLPETGIADEATQSVLFSANALENPTEYHLFINLSEQCVYVYKRNGNGTYDHFATYVCSTGLHDTTPQGVFLNTKPLDRWHYFTKFQCWAQYAYQIIGDIYFHSVIYSNKNESSLRASSLYALGSRASHGCVRLKVDAAKFIFENCPAGTPIIVY